MIVFQILAIIVLYASFGLVHTVLAKLNVKKSVAVRYPKLLPYYRLFYTLLSFMHLYFVYRLTPSIDIKLYDLQYPYDFIILIFQLQGLLGFLWTFQYFNVKEFLGINQLFRKIHDNYENATLDEESKLIIKGPFLWCRHPEYFFVIMFLVLRPTMSLDYFVSLICIVAYFYIGTFYEEQRLLEKFGEHYSEYQKLVPRLLPIRFRKR